MNIHTTYFIIIGFLIFIIFQILKSRFFYKRKTITQAEDLVNYKKELTFYNIETAPKDKLILLAFESSDCGWTVDLAQWYRVTDDDGYWAVYAPDGSVHKLDFAYTHWMLPSGMYHKTLIKES